MRSNIFNFSMPNLTLKEWFSAIFVLVIFMLPATSAFAIDLNAAGVTPPPDSDVSIQGLDQIFGVLGGNPEYNILGNIMGIWGGVMMFVGSILVGYIIFAGVLKTAHEGQALGQQWNSMWIPFRASMGLAATAPLMAGYSAVQLIVLWCAIQGVGIADMMWSSAVDKISKNGGFVTTPLSNKDAFEVNSKIYLANSCMVALNKQIAADKANGISDDPMIRLYQDTDGSLRYGVPAGTGNGAYGPSECGAFEWGYFDTAGAGYEGSTATGTNFTNVGGSLGPEGYSLGKQIIDSQRQAIIQSSNIMLPIVIDRQAEAQGLAPTASQLKPAVDIYTKTMADNVKNVSSFVKKEGLDSFGTDAAKDGWALAGAYYARIGHFNSAANEILKSAPTGIFADVSYDDHVKIQMAQAQKDIDALSKELEPGSSSQNNDMTGTGFWSAIAHPMLNLQEVMIGQVGEAGDPMARTQNFGHLMLDAGYIMITPVIAADIAGAELSDIPLVGKIPGKLLGYFSAIGMSLIGILFLAGAMLAYVFPMVPYMLMLFAVMSWFTSVFIAVVAAPLWAVSHATPDGDDAFGSGKNGYVLLMSVVLRPSLTILAMFGSMAIMFAMDKILNLGYMTAFAGAQANSMSGVIGLIVGFLLYAVISLILVYGCFRLVQTVPDAILQWIGGRDDDSIGVEQHGDKVGAMAVQFKSQAQQMGGAGLGGLADAGSKAAKAGAGAGANIEKSTKDLSAGDSSLKP